MENITDYKDIVTLEQEVCSKLKIQDIAEDLLGKPTSKKSKNGILRIQPFINLKKRHHLKYRKNIKYFVAFRLNIVEM